MPEGNDHISIPFQGTSGIKLSDQLEQSIYDEEAEREPPLNDQQRARLREYARVQAESVLMAQGLLTAKEDLEARKQPYGGDVDLFDPSLGGTSNARSD